MDSGGPIGQKFDLLADFEPFSGPQGDFASAPLSSHKPTRRHPGPPAAKRPASARGTEERSLPTDRTIIFDLDGTLVDTAPDLCRALNFVLMKFGRPTIDNALVRKYVGFGAFRLIEHGIAHVSEPAPRELVNDMERDFLAYYEANIAVDSHPFPGAVEALETFGRNGARLGICTNKREGLSRSLLEALDLDRYFHSVLGADSLEFRKPDPRHLVEAIVRAGGKPERAVMIGDSATDVATARAAKVPIIVVSFGYTDIPPAELGGDLIIDHYDELDAAISRVL